MTYSRVNYHFEVYKSVFLVKFSSFVVVVVVVCIGTGGVTHVV